jgi:hypothetical protein
MWREQWTSHGFCARLAVSRRYRWKIRPTDRQFQEPVLLKWWGIVSCAETVLEHLSGGRKIRRVDMCSDLSGRLLEVPNLLGNKWQLSRLGSSSTTQKPNACTPTERPRAYQIENRANSKIIHHAACVLGSITEELSIVPRTQAVSQSFCVQVLECSRQCITGK